MEQEAIFLQWLEPGEEYQINKYDQLEFINKVNLEKNS